MYLISNQQNIFMVDVWSTICNIHIKNNHLIYSPNGGVKGLYFASVAFNLIRYKAIFIQDGHIGVTV